MHVRVGRKRKHSVTGRMIDVTLRAVSSYLVLGSELGILLGFIYLHIEDWKTFSTMSNLDNLGGLHRYGF